MIKLLSSFVFDSWQIASSLSPMVKSKNRSFSFFLFSFILFTNTVRSFSLRICTRKEFIPFLLGQQNDKRVFTFDTRKKKSSAFFSLCRLYMLDNRRLTDIYAVIAITHSMCIFLVYLFRFVFFEIIKIRITFNAHTTLQFKKHRS